MSTRQKISLILFLCIIAFSILRAEDKSVIKLIPVYEKTFQDTIVDVIFDTATVSITKAKAMGWKEEAFDEEEIVKRKATISYPKVVFYGTPDTPIKGKVREIRFLREDGKVFKVLQVGRKEDVIKSHSGNYILIMKRAYEDNPYSNWVVYTIKGKVVSEKKGDYGVVPVDISDDGHIAGVKYPVFPGGPFGDGFIYDVEGNEIIRVKNPLIVDEGWASAKFSDEDVIFGFSDLRGNSVIKFVRKNGKVEWEREIPMTSYFLLRSDKELGIVCIFNDNKIKPYQIYAYCIGWNGNVKWRTPLEIGGTMDIKIDPFSKNIYVASWMGYLWKINYKTGNVELVYAADWSKNILKKVDRHRNLPEFVSIEINEKFVFVRGTPWESKDFSVIFIFDRLTKNLKESIQLPNICYSRLFRGRFYVFQSKKMKNLGIKRKELQK